MKHGGMKYSGGSGSKKLGQPPAGGMAIGGITVPKGGVVAAGATLSTKGARGSAGEKGRATDPNCDKVRSHPGNP